IFSPVPETTFPHFSTPRNTSLQSKLISKKKRKDKHSERYKAWPPPPPSGHQSRPLPIVVDSACITEDHQCPERLALEKKDDSRPKRIREHAGITKYALGKRVSISAEIRSCEDLATECVSGVIKGLMYSAIISHSAFAPNPCVTRFERHHKHRIGVRVATRSNNESAIKCWCCEGKFDVDDD
ncbi:hypothetical protein AVEN_175962-1, partial [Araneus ventricosus]